MSVLCDAAARRLLASAHDVSAGGLGVCLAEAAIAGRRGFTVRLDARASPHRVLFSESPSRAVVSCSPDDLGAVLALARQCAVEAAAVGTVGGDVLDFGAFRVSLSAAERVFEDALPSHLVGRVDAWSSATGTTSRDG